MFIHLNSYSVQQVVSHVYLQNFLLTDNFMYHISISLKFPLDYTILTLQPEANGAYLKSRRMLATKITSYIYAWLPTEHKKMFKRTPMLRCYSIVSDGYEIYWDDYLVNYAMSNH